MPRKTKIQIWKYPDTNLLAIIIGKKTLFLTNPPELHNIQVSKEVFELMKATKIYEN